MKIRCGSHQQNRSIVRPGLSLMATKVALTAEEFRENSQRSIDLFNTEKLSTDSTHVRKKCILQFCAFLPLQSARGVWRQRVVEVPESLILALQSARGVWRQSSPILTVYVEGRSCNLHGACGGKDNHHHSLLISAQVAICTGRVEAKDSAGFVPIFSSVAICTGRVEAKTERMRSRWTSCLLQSARGVWRQSSSICIYNIYILRCNLHGACGGKASKNSAQTGKALLQSARGVWRQSCYK